MKTGMIHETVKRQARSLITTSIVCFVVCLAVLGYNWKYLFNWVAGPVPLSATLAANPGAREWVSVHGKIQPTGFGQKSVLKIKGIKVSENVSAEYMAIQLGDRQLLVLVPPKFAGDAVEGRLVPVPAEIAQEQTGSAFYPWMVSATTGYRWDFNLFVLAAVVLFPLAALFLSVCLWRGTDPARNPAIRKLQRFGPPLQIVDAIETEIASAGPAGKVGPLFFTPSWVVILEPILEICSVSEIVAIARDARTKKSGGKLVEAHYVLVWQRGESSPKEAEVAEATARAALEKVTALYPGTAVEDAVEFRRKWSTDRAACEREAEQRKKAPAGPGSVK